MILYALAFILSFNQSKSAEIKPVNYFVYHEYINKAEFAFFLNNNVDSALCYYDIAFSQFQFVFVHDVVNAAQMAFYSKRPYEKYLKRGFKHGLKLEHLKNIPLFKDEYKRLNNETELTNAYSNSRKEYLKTIDFDYLNWLYNLAVDDQNDKDLPNMQYDIMLEKNLYKLIKKIESNGFPSRKTIGIDDSTIFKEVGNANLDISVKKLKYKNLSYMRTSDECLSSDFALIFLVHHPCSYSKIEHILLAEIKKGNIHPREVGLVYDNLFRFKDSRSQICPMMMNKNSVYRLNAFTNYKPLNYSENQIDSLRRQLNIVPLKIDKIKKEFETTKKFKLFWGFWDCL
jgi:hypothetical protein